MSALKAHAVRTAFVAMAMTISGVATAAEIANLSGQSCGALTGEWHFVNNGVPIGTAPGTLTANWSSGASCTTTSTFINRKTQHFYCTASGELQNASTNLPGRLVLSNFSCETKCVIDPNTKECVVPK